MLYINKTICFAYTFCDTPRRRHVANYILICELRNDRDLLHNNLAAYLQCSQVCYSYYEMGKRDIPTDILVRLADFYGTSVDYLLGRTDETKPYPPALR